MVAALLVNKYWQHQPPAAPVAQNSSTAELGGELTVVSGTVELKGEDGEWVRADKTESVFPGDSVEVVGEGRAVIMLDDGSAVRLDGNTAVTFSKIAGDGITIVNDKGHVYTRVAKADRPFVVQVAGVSYQSMGTAYKTLNDAAVQGVEVFESKVKVLGASESEVLVDSGNKYYVVNTKDKKIEKKLVKINPQELQKDEFVQWNKKEDVAIADDSEKADDTADVTTTKLETSEMKATEDKKDEVTDAKTEDNRAVKSITARQASAGVVSWTIDGYSSQGFKIVWSKSPYPTYPTRDSDRYIYLSDPKARTTGIDPFDDVGTYYVRVCEYLGGKCGVYSNQIQMKLGDEEPVAAKAVRSIHVSSQGGGAVSWSIDGYSSMGYKIVWSKSPSPVYPTRDSDQYIYLSEPDAESTTVNAFDGAGTYYVRVCEYLGGKCGVYSNQITVDLE